MSAVLGRQSGGRSARFGACANSGIQAPWRRRLPQTAVQQAAVAADGGLAAEALLRGATSDF